MGIAMAESSKKNTPKTLDHLEIHPQLGGGHIVKHFYSGYEHDSKDVKFNEAGTAKGGEHIQKHLDKYAGLPAAAGNDKQEKNDESETEDEV